MSTVQSPSRAESTLPTESFEQFLPVSRKSAKENPDQEYAYANADDKAPAFSEYKAIGRPDEVAAGTIRFETVDGKKVIVLQSTSPALFEQVKRDFESLKAVNGATDNGDNAVGKDDKAPESLRDVQKVEEVTQDVVRYRNKDGDWSVVAKGTNPEFFEKVSGYKESLDGIKASEDDGYRRATDNEEWPPYSGIQVGPVDEVGPGTIRYDNGDEKVVVHKDDNPGLFDYLSGMQKIVTDPASRERMDKAQGDGFELAQKDGDAPKYQDIKNIKRADGIITVETFDGKKTAVSEQLSPKMYEQLSTHTDVMAKANEQEKEGYATLHPDDYLTSDEISGATIGPEGEIGEGFVRAEIFDGEGGSRKVVVSEELSPELYDRLVAEDSGRRNSTDKIDEARGEHDLPKTGDVDIGSMETSEKDPNDDKRNLTVTELTWQKTVDGWKKGMEDGSIKDDDVRAKLFRALQAQGMLENGATMVTLDISLGQSTAQATGDDFATVIDGRAVDQKLNELFSSEAVQKDFVDAQKSAVDALPNKDEVVKKLEDMAFSEEYVKYIADLQFDKKGDLAEADMRETYAALATVDPEKAAQFAQQMQMDTMMIDLDRLLQDPSKITDENLTLATQDTVKTWLTALKKAGVDLPRRTAESMDKFVEEILNDKQTAKDFGKALQQLGDRYTKNGEITQADIDGLMKSDVYQALNEKTNGGMLTTIAELNKNGTLGSAGGMISLASGIYQMAGGKLGGTPEERLAIAKEMVGFFGASQHFVNLGTNVIDAINGTDLNRVMALDKSLPEIFGKDKGKGKSPALAEPSFEKFSENVSSLMNDASVDSQKKLNTLLDLDDAGKEDVLKGMHGEYAKNPLIKGANMGTRGISAFLRVLDAGANTFVGAADVALGALMIKGGMQSNDGATIAQGAVTVAAGSFGIGGGAASLGALKGLAFARAAVGPMFWASAALTLATLPFAIIQDIKYNNQLDDHRSSQADLIKQFESDGLLSEDGLTRYEFLDDYMYNYAQRDAPDDQSIFEYREEEYAFYSDEGHLPEAGWDDVKHEDYDGDGNNLDTQMA
ncbi:MFS transporter [Pseudomonas matsuisoli]|uniref:Uncharacterized protein n=1 Tax=Pseudomonas matsuisoli TaxID=1515666 RepID=A0A917PPE3_9PSED|nr:MFS transporter [Pseudomonas matsuisoli]GGJ85889.1 hypothetical protein GCM10009304_09970 [Pseudomonas matsuisoli]